tara:strand:- start:133299 stop:133502 length:204 start_codon:yes stop_codon:yes gene_type:complete
MYKLTQKQDVSQENPRGGRPKRERNPAFFKAVSADDKIYVDSGASESVPKSEVESADSVSTSRKNNR